MSSYIESISQATTAATGKSAAKSKDDAVMGKQDFLTLLVAQLQNQDPLSPDDPTEFTAQLAQFSSLEQLFTLNESMNNLVTSNANSDSLSTLNTIGKDVAYTGSSFKFTGEPIELGYKLDGQASAVTLALQNNGVTVATLQGKDLSVGNHYMTWDGLTKDGIKASSGDYKIVLQAKAATGESVAVSPLIKSEVTGVDLGGQSGGTLITKAGEIAFNSIIGVYDPGTRAGTSATVAETTKETSVELKDTVAAVAEITDDVKDIIE
ncbi:MAG: flagellar hook assembly protein FlgD [Proteobacteria bacterium]|nr:flagellar hook assembly protein FlgD [Pseudomonadota bacterium]